MTVFVTTRKSPIRKPSIRVATVTPPSPPTTHATEMRQQDSRGRTEGNMIATALHDAPALDREAMGAELYPFNAIASAESVQAVIAKIVRRRIPGSPWTEAHDALMKTDENGKGYAEFMDTTRDVTFMVGVDYALRSLPSWWSDYQSLDRDGQALLGAMVADMADAVAARKGGTR
jgi:hypothetical protein